MREQPVAPVTSSSLGERLQDITEQLAAATTPGEVFKIALTPALDALGAVAGAVLLVDETGEKLQIAGTRGYEAGAQTIWQDGPLSGDLPAGSALQRHEALFFEHAGDLVRAYPQLEARAGDVAPVASAVLPMFLDERPLGAIVLDFQETHDFTGDEQRFLRTLAAQCALALGLARSLERFRQEVHQKTDILESISDAFYAVDFEWRFTYVNKEAERLWGRRREDLLGKVYWDEFPQAVGSLPYEAHLRAARERRVARLEAVSPILRAWLDITIYPTESGVSVYFKDITARKQAEEEIRELNRTLEERIQGRTREAEDARARAEVLAVLSDAVQSATTPEDVAELALGKLGPALRAQSMLVVRLDGEGVRLPTLWGETPEPIVSYMTRLKLKLAETPVLRRVAESGQGVYLQDYSRERGAVASFPPLANAVEPVHTPEGTLEGFLEVWRPMQEGLWLEGERDLLRRAAGTLGLALERAEQARRLADRNEELGARTRALEAFQEWSRDLTLNAEPATLIERAEELLLALLPAQAALHYERQGPRWFVRSMRGSYGSEGLRLAHEAGLLHSETANLRVPFETGETYYQDEYEPTTDGLADHMAHVSATAIVPLRTGRGVRGLLGLGRFGQNSWTSAERSIIETVRRSLELALDRAEQAAELEKERAALSARSDELTKANEELEAFAHSVSHDLRTPVRHIVGFAALLRRSMGEALPAKAAHYLLTIEQAAARMNTLIDAMLGLARTSRQPLLPQRVALQELFERARSELKVDVAGRQVTWRVASLPDVLGDRDTLQQVVTNLLANAVKYTRTKASALIEVWAEERPDEWAIFVRDNGVGFDPRYEDRLFGVFSRLHRDEEFEGTGVGLANVRRIITRHGGTVFARSVPGEGATFGFTLPKAN